MPLPSEEMEEVIQFETDCIANILRAKAPDDAKELLIWFMMETRNSISEKGLKTYR